jgi:hypothetical protein
MTAKGQVAQFLWIGPRLSLMEKLCLRSFVDVGYDVHLYAYDKVDNVPPGVVLCDAGAILPQKEIFTYSVGFGQGSAAGFSDRFRYHLLTAKGGWWFDTDFVALRMLAQPREIYFASTWELEWGSCANGCAMWVRPGDPYMQWLRDECDRLIRVKGNELRFGEIGPHLVQRLVREFDLGDRVAPWWEFCPYPWRMVNRMAYSGILGLFKDKGRLAKHLIRQTYDEQFRVAYLRKESRAVHLHNEIWRSSGLDKDAIYHPWSLVGSLQRKHGFRA